MDFEVILRKEQQDLEKFIEGINAEIAYRRGRIKMLEEIMKGEASDGQEPGSVVGSTREDAQAVTLTSA